MGKVLWDDKAWTCGNGEAVVIGGVATKVIIVTIGIIILGLW